VACKFACVAIWPKKKAKEKRKMLVILQKKRLS
jgi:hypothetical protein